MHAGGGMTMPPVPVRAVPAVSSDVPLTISAVGNVEAMATVDVKSRVAGQVVRVAFEEGQNVQKGQLLFEIDPEALRRQITEYQANLAKDQALEQQARANVVKDQATLKQARSSADRGLQLSKEGIYSREQTEQVVATADSSQAAMDADKAAVDSSVAAIASDKAKIAETQLQLDYTKINAPISGRAGAIAVKAGNLIKDNDVALVTLLQISPSTSPSVYRNSYCLRSRSLINSIPYWSARTLTAKTPPQALSVLSTIRLTTPPEPSSSRQSFRMRITRSGRVSLSMSKRA